LAKNIEHVQFELTPELLDTVNQLITLKKDTELSAFLDGYHYADIAEILDETDLDSAIYIIKLLDSDTTADILKELDDDIREQILKSLIKPK